jgi:hypothetical protein
MAYGAGPFGQSRLAKWSAGPGPKGEETLSGFAPGLAGTTVEVLAVVRRGKIE